MFTPIGFFAPSGFAFGGVTDGLKFSLEAEAGSTFQDTSGNGITFTESGTSNGGITHTVAGTGSFWFFNQSTTFNTNYVASTYVPASGLNTFSYCAIVRWETPPPGNTNQGPMFEASDAGQEDLWMEYNPFSANYIKQTLALNANYPEFEYNTGANARYKWWMISGTASGTTFKFYVNGTEVYSQAFSQGINVSNGMSIHRWPASLRSSIHSKQMTMGAFTWYNKGLSAAEIATNYAYFQTFYTGL
jgi:hypothetical protein